jgi:TPR repeat protein
MAGNAPSASGAVDELLATLRNANDTQQIEAALRGLKRLADRGSPIAAFRYGQLVATGQYGPSDAKAAERYLRTAAKAGHADAQYALANLLLAGTPQSGAHRDEAIGWLRRSAAALPDSVYMLALLQAQSAPDPKQAEQEVVRKAAGTGYAPAQYRLAAEQLRQPADPERDRAALDLLQRAAEQGHIVAMLDLGILLLEGRRVAGDPARAVPLLDRTAAAGNARAEYVLGRAYSMGEGVAMDAARGIGYLQRAAAKRLSEAEYAMGFAYTQGVGAPVDDAKALVWFQRAAAQSYPDALFAIGNAYSNGYAVAKDVKLADDWYCKAAKVGHVAAIERMRYKPPGFCELPAKLPAN